MAKQKVTVMIEDQAVPSLTELAIPEQDLPVLYRTMVRTRRVDERMVALQRQGRIGFYIGSVGEEAAIVGSAYALRRSDWIVPSYRELGAAFLRGFSLKQLCCQLLGNSGDPAKGRQMPNHFSAVEQNFVSISSPVGTQIPQATGIAWASKIRGHDNVVLVYFGDGATSEGDFHVGLNFAGVYRLPLVFFCRNNQWAISVPSKKQTASESIAIKAKAYGFEGIRVDGNDLLAVHEVTHRAVEKARSGNGPTLIEAVTYRQGAHSTSDDPRGYRAEAEVDEWKSRDPIGRFRQYLEKNGLWDEEQESALQEELQKEIQATIKESEALPPPALETLFADVYAERPWHLKEQYQECHSLLGEKKDSR